MGNVYQIEIPAENIPSAFDLVGFLNINNKCCPKKPVLITKTKGVKVFSCQCYCGGWCTNGCESIQDAITEWQQMK